MAELTAGFMLAYGIVCAIVERERSGKGQWVHTSLLQANIRLMDFQTVRYLPLIPGSRFSPLLKAGHAPQSDRPATIARLVEETATLRAIA